MKWSWQGGREAPPECKDTVFDPSNNLPVDHLSLPRFGTKISANSPTVFLTLHTCFSETITIE